VRRAGEFEKERGTPSSQFYLLCLARGLRVFNAAENFAESFLWRYARTWPERIELRRLDVGSLELFRGVEDQERDGFNERSECGATSLYGRSLPGEPLSSEKARVSHRYKASIQSNVRLAETCIGEMIPTRRDGETGSGAS
jgi:hypothetical protein